ncbi:hypothetical protein LRD69_01445 [Streptomyces sp. JH14]|uniref:hypothetical protein n=1 Tax=Streptomyces sp. JH14 TaxID=2793630 RepID=UPI0023F81D78|nr:hypothetical protein [Streptomyces sp. JH14]MDF6040853.1 hypothetical protein [Streptomyces sp. JH14]
MSDDLAVWEGERPADDKTAGQVFNDLSDRLIDAAVDRPPAEGIAAYVAALLERWPSGGRSSRMASRDIGRTRRICQ